MRGGRAATAFSAAATAVMPFFSAKFPQRTSRRENALYSSATHLRNTSSSAFFAVFRRSCARATMPDGPSERSDSQSGHVCERSRIARNAPLESFREKRRRGDEAMNCWILLFARCPTSLLSSVQYANSWFFARHTRTLSNMVIM